MLGNPTSEGSLESAVERSRRRLLALSGLKWACVAAAIALVGPVLMLAGAPPVTALATNKVQGVFGSATAAIRASTPPPCIWERRTPRWGPPWDQ